MLIPYDLVNDRLMFEKVRGKEYQGGGDTLRGHVSRPPSSTHQGNHWHSGSFRQLPRVSCV
jgi:hypothetical protein